MKIRMTRNVRSDIIGLSKPGTILRARYEYAAKSNQHGAISGLCDNGIWLGVRPGELIEVDDLKDVGKNENSRYLIDGSIRELESPIPTKLYAEIWGTRVHPATTEAENTNRRKGKRNADKDMN